MSVDYSTIKLYSIVAPQCADLFVFVSYLCDSYVFPERAQAVLCLHLDRPVIMQHLSDCRQLHRLTGKHDAQ